MFHVPMLICVIFFIFEISTSTAESFHALRAKELAEHLEMFDQVCKQYCLGEAANGLRCNGKVSVNPRDDL